jgi:hypothetical protein
MMMKARDVNINWCKNMYDYLEHYGNMTDMHCQVGTIQFAMEGTVGDTFRNAYRLALQSHHLFFEKETSLDTSNVSYVDEIMKEVVKHRSYLTYYQCWGRKPLFEMEKRTSGTMSINGSNTVLSRKQSLASSRRSGGLFRRGAGSLHEDTTGETDKGNFTSPRHSNSPDLWDLNELGTALDEDNVSDIDQFVQGFEE